MNEWMEWANKILSEYEQVTEWMTDEWIKEWMHVCDACIFKGVDIALF